MEQKDILGKASKLLRRSAIVYAREPRQKVGSTRRFLIDSKLVQAIDYCAKSNAVLLVMIDSFSGYDDIAGALWYARDHGVEVVFAPVQSAALKGVELK